MLISLDPSAVTNARTPLSLINAAVGEIIDSKPMPLPHAELPLEKTGREREREREEERGKRGWEEMKELRALIVADNAKKTHQRVPKKKFVSQEVCLSRALSLINRLSLRTLIQAR